MCKLSSNIEQKKKICRSLNFGLNAFSGSIPLKAIILNIDFGTAINWITIKVNAFPNYIKKNNFILP